MKGLLKMSDIEILGEILNELKAINNKVDNFERDVKEQFNSLENKFNSLENRVKVLENKSDALEREVKHNTLITESTVDQCIKVLGDGWKFNAERFDRLDIDNVRMKTDQAFMMSKLVNEKLDKLSEKIGKAG